MARIAVEGEPFKGQRMSEQRFALAKAIKEAPSLKSPPALDSLGRGGLNLRGLQDRGQSDGSPAKHAP